MSRSELSRGNALRRTLLLLADLVRGKRHDRHSAAARLHVRPAAADRRLREMVAHFPGIRSRVLPGRRREYFFDPSGVLQVKKPTRQSIVAACFGASLGNLLEGAYKAAMQGALGHLLRKRRTKYAEVDRKFWFVRRGGEASLPGKEDLLDELVDALIEQNVTDITYEQFDGTVKSYRIWPLSAVIHDHQLYFFAWTKSQRLRFFRFSRIREAERTDETFVYPARTAYDPDQLLRDSFGIFVGDTHPVESVRIKLSSRWAAFTRNHRWHPSQKNDDDEATKTAGGDVVVSFRVRTCPEFEQWILGFGEEARVLAPVELRDRVADRLRKAARNYDE